MQDIKGLLGKRIKEIRKVKGLSQQQLAELSGIDQRSLSHIECGDTFPSKSLFDLAKALNISLKELFDFEHHSLSVAEKREYIATNLKNISDNDINSIYRIIKAFL